MCYYQSLVTKEGLCLVSRDWWGGRPAMMKPGSLGQLFDCSLWEQRRREGLQFRPQQEEEKNITRGEGGKPSPTAADEGQATTCSEVFQLLLSFVPRPAVRIPTHRTFVAATPWGAQQERGCASEFQQWQRQQRPVVEWGDGANSREASWCLADPEQKRPAYLSQKC